MAKNRKIFGFCGSIVSAEMICMPSEIGEYKGHPTISLTKDEDDEHPFTFGLTKAKLILAHIDAIRKFVEENKE